MRTRAAFASVLASTAVLVLGWQLGADGSQAVGASASDDLAPETTSSVAPSTDPRSDDERDDEDDDDRGTAPSSTPSATAAASPSAAAQSSSSSSASSSASSSSSTSASAGVSGTFTGTSVPTKFGSVQVQIVVAGGKITEVDAIQLTDRDQKSISISNRAAPILASEIVAAQSADVDSVSGATYTTDAYLESAQAAIDAAGL